MCPPRIMSQNVLPRPGLENMLFASTVKHSSLSSTVHCQALLNASARALPFHRESGGMRGKMDYMKKLTTSKSGRRTLLRIGRLDAAPGNIQHDQLDIECFSLKGVVYPSFNHTFNERVIREITPSHTPARAPDWGSRSPAKPTRRTRAPARQHKFPKNKIGHSATHD